MKHRATPRFWSCYRQLPEETQRLADRAYELLKNDPRHPSLHFKKVGDLWSVRVGLHYRALAVEDADDMLWVGSARTPTTTVSFNIGHESCGIAWLISPPARRRPYRRV